LEKLPQLCGQKLFFEIIGTMLWSKKNFKKFDHKKKTILIIKNQKAICLSVGMATHE